MNHQKPLGAKISSSWGKGMGPSLNTYKNVGEFGGRFHKQDFTPKEIPLPPKAKFNFGKLPEGKAQI